MPTGKRDPYYNNPKARVEALKHIQEQIRSQKPTRWICWCGNVAEGNAYNSFDADGWSGVIVCTVCGRNMQRRKD